MMIENIEDYFSKGCGRCSRFATTDCATTRWAQGLKDLRTICLKADLTETVKWGHPCYMYSDRNIAIIGAFRDDFRLTFFNAALLKDPKRILERRGPNTRHPDMIRFSSNDQVTRIAPIIRSYLDEALEYATKGVKPLRDSSELALPVEMADALDADPELAQAFFALTPGRRKSYVINLNSAKQSATRVMRVAKFREKIISGKGAMER